MNLSNNYFIFIIIRACAFLYGIEERRKEKKGEGEKERERRKRADKKNGMKKSYE